MSVLLYERYPVDPVRSREFEHAANELLSALRKAPGALWAELSRAVDGDQTYLLIAEWRTEADADAWAASGPAVEFMRAVDVLLGAEITRRRFVSPA